MAQWSIRWILDHPEITTVIPGASKVAQVYSNVAASALPQLTQQTHTALRELYDKDIYKKIRGQF
jgi:aryl-alcohol dehydrogenase-like predicted oxidoreductase